MISWISVHYQQCFTSCCTQSFIGVSQDHNSIHIRLTSAMFRKSLGGKKDKKDKRATVLKGDYVAKQKVTLWNYEDGGTTLIPYNVPEKAELEVTL